MKQADFTNALLHVQQELGMLKDDITPEVVEEFAKALTILLRCHMIRLPPVVNLKSK